MQFPGQAKPPVGILFDSDLGNRIDDVLAMAVMYGLDGKDEVRVVSISITKTNLRAAALAEVVARFFSGAVSAEFAAVGRTLPVGMSEKGLMREDTPLLAGPLDRKDEKGAPVYAHGIHKLNDTGDPVAVIRNGLTSQHDQNCFVVLAGPATNLAEVMKLPGAKELIAKKARYLVVSGGAFAEGPAEFAMKTDVAAAKKLFAEWPTPVVVCGAEVGAALRFPGASIEKDFAWSQAHPVVDAYRAAQAMPDDAPAGDMAAVLYAGRPKEGYFQLSEPGTVTVLDDGRTRFTPSAEGKHRYLIVDPEQKEKAVQAMVELASSKPVIRQRRRRRPDANQEQKQAAPPKPAEEKK